MHSKTVKRGPQPPLTTEAILALADQFHRQNGRWPQTQEGTPWRAIDEALRKGWRGLPGGSSLARLLAQQRGVRNKQGLPPLTREMILHWADRHHERTGQWPRHRSGPIPEAPGETWMIIDTALQMGSRGLPGETTLYQLLQTERPPMVGLDPKARAERSPEPAGGVPREGAAVG